MEGLTGLTYIVVELGEFRGFLINEEEFIDILQFTNVTIILGVGNSDNLWSVKAF